FYYRNNKTAWMTSAYFKESLQDLHFKSQNQHIALTIDNFSVELDDAGDDDIYKINLLEVMLMVRDAWDAVTPETIRNCWKHTKITEAIPDTPASSNLICSTPNTQSPLADAEAWQIIKNFATGIIETLPNAQEQLAARLGLKYHYNDWKPAFDAIFAAKDDEMAAATAIDHLASKSLYPAAAAPHLQEGLPKPPTRPLQPSLPQLSQLETELMNTIEDLQHRKQICGTAPTLEDLLNPIEEDVIGHTGLEFPGGDDEIIGKRRKCSPQTTDGVACGRAQQVSSGPRWT
ncbi:uncharacterized protein F5891DRAFT_916658, partial [Suillus fuscotomentosus]